jgi:hypothetical protein
MFATRRSIVLTVAAVLLISLLSAGVFVWLKFYPTGADVPLLKTPDWELKDLNEYRDTFLLRRETADGGALLLKRTDIETVYRYDPKARTVKAVNGSVWENAGGQIRNCKDYMPPAVYSRQQPVVRAYPHIDVPTKRLLIDQREVKTAARYPIETQQSPSGRWLSVLSGAGPSIPPLLPLSGDWVLGQRYHEVLSLPDGSRVGSAIRFPVLDTKDFGSMCWSADEQFVVYTSWTFRALVVIETGVNSR